MASVTVRTLDEDFMTCLAGHRARVLADGLMGGRDVRPMLADRGASRDDAGRVHRMSGAAELREALLRVRAEVSSARAFFCTWNALNMAQVDKQYLRTMNDYRNVDFFLVSMEGNFRLFFLSLGNMFDKRKDSVSLHLLHRRLHETNRHDLERELEKVLKRHAPTIESIRKIRNKSIAHLDKDSMEAVFRSAAITPNQIETLIDAVCDLLSMISAAFDFPDRISKGDRHENAVQFLLDTLHRGRLS